MTRRTITLALSLFVSVSPVRAEDEEPPAATPEEQRAMEAARRAGASFYRDYRRPGAPVDSMLLTPKSPADVDLALGFTHLESLDVSHEGVTDAVMARIGELTRLKHLRLYNPSITDAGLAHLRGLPELANLEIDGAPITDSGLRHLAGLHQLESLVLRNVPVTDAGLVHVGRLSHVRSITLHDTGVTPAGVARLKAANPYALVQVHDARDDGDWQFVVVAVVLAAVLGLVMWMVRRAARARRPWAWKAGVVAVLIGLPTCALLRLTPVMRPVKDGDAGTFWLRATGVDVNAARSTDSLGGWYLPRDGWYLSYTQGFHGQDLDRVPVADVRAHFPKVVERLRRAPPGRVRPHVERAFHDWVRTGAGPDDADGFLAKPVEARYREYKRPGRSFEEYVRWREDGLDERWERFGRYARNFWFEFAFFSGLILFGAWPWLRGRGRAQCGVHLGLVPTLLFLPYWLGYAPYARTSAGPVGGILYPWVIGGPVGPRDVPWADLDLAIVRRLPRPLEPLSQTPGPMLSLSGSGAAGPLTTVAVGLAVFAVVAYGPVVLRWLESRGGKPATRGGRPGGMAGGPRPASDGPGTGP